MILFLGMDGEIKSYSKNCQNPEIQKEGVVYDGEFNFFMGENKESFVKKFYYDKETKQIHIDYQPEKEEIVVNSSEAKLDYLMMIQGGEEV